MAIGSAQQIKHDLRYIPGCGEALKRRNCVTYAMPYYIYDNTIQDLSGWVDVHDAF